MAQKKVKVVLTQSLSGTLKTWNVGDEYECSVEEAGRLCGKGIAVSDDPQVKSAAESFHKKRENAMLGK